MVNWMKGTMENQNLEMPGSSSLTLKSIPDLLSPRELEIIDVITEGLDLEGFNDEQVAARLNIAVSTVRTHIKRIYQKLQAGECSEMIRQ